MNRDKEIIEHIIELKASMASVNANVHQVQTILVGKHGDGGLQQRVVVLEHERTRQRAIMATLTAVAGAMGGIVSWVFSHMPKV